MTVLQLSAQFLVLLVLGIQVHDLFDALIQKLLSLMIL